MIEDRKQYKENTFPKILRLILGVRITQNYPNRSYGFRSMCSQRWSQGKKAHGLKLKPEQNLVKKLGSSMGYGW